MKINNTDIFGVKLALTIQLLKKSFLGWFIDRLLAEIDINIWVWDDLGDIWSLAEDGQCFWTWQ